MPQVRVGTTLTFRGVPCIVWGITRIEASRIADRPAQEWRDAYIGVDPGDHVMKPVACEGFAQGDHIMERHERIDLKIVDPKTERAFYSIHTYWTVEKDKETTEDGRETNEGSVGQAGSSTLQGAGQGGESSEGVRPAGAGADDRAVDRTGRVSEEGTGGAGETQEGVSTTIIDGGNRAAG